MKRKAMQASIDEDDSRVGKETKENLPPNKRVEHKQRSGPSVKRKGADAQTTSGASSKTDDVTVSGPSSTTSKTAGTRQPLSARPQRSAAPRTRFGFAAVPPVPLPPPAATSSSGAADASADVSASKATKPVGKPGFQLRTARRSSVKLPGSSIIASGAISGGGNDHGARADQGPSAVQEAADRCFSQSDEAVEGLIKTKLKVNSRWDFKEKIAKRDEALKALRDAIQGLLAGKKAFVDACTAVELRLEAELFDAREGQREASNALRSVEEEVTRLKATTKTLGQRLGDAEQERVEAGRNAEAAKTENMELTRSVARLEKEVQRASSELESLRVASKHWEAEAATKAEAEAQASVAHAQEVARLTALLSELEASLQTTNAAREAVQSELTQSKARAKEGEGRRAKEESERVRLETECAKLLEDLSSARQSLVERSKELAELQVDGGKRVAELTAEVAVLQGSKNMEEEARVNAEKEVERLKAKLEGIRDAVDEKSRELSMALKSFTDMQRSTQDREGELRKSLKEAEERAVRSEARLQGVEADVVHLRTAVVGSTAETAALKELLSAARDEAKARLDAEQTARAQLQEASSSLAVERELRARAERKEEEERHERTACNAQLLAMQRELSEGIERVKAQCAEEARGWTERAKADGAERQKLAAELRSSQEAVLTLEGELRTLKRVLEDAESRTEQLDELGKVAGEADVLRHRLLEAEKAKAEEQQKHNQQMAAMEKSIQDGEVQRRKLHNMIQELRGNVRVFARVRPFLPSDGNEPLACIDVNTHDESMVITKRAHSGPDASILESSRFSFDKVFAPSAGQEMVFQEVSELVQSALDGYNVCLFSYGQTGSGKTHSMIGCRSTGPLKGIIPRAMEQVGLYKKKLEGQGWVYKMQVTFVEIYNETIRDLLKSLGPDGDAGGGKQPVVSHEIKRDAKQNLYVSDLHYVAVDPNDEKEIERIMEVAARHRSVGSTDMNSQSSRSHSIFTLHLRAVNTQQRAELTGKLNLVDLAGSERLSRSHAAGDRLKETQAINKSLSALTDIFVAISNKQAHIPYRNSKLTYLLQPCFSGDGKCLMLVNLSPSDESYHESLCTLRFAAHVNKCELGRPRRSLHQTGGPVSNGPYERASTLTSATASSASRGAR